jgi:nucleotide-binding universal stress UspA family protein
VIVIAFDGSDGAKEAVRVAGEMLPAGRPAAVATVCEPLEKLPFFGHGLPSDQGTMDAIFRGARGAAQKVAEEGAARAREAGFDAEPLMIEGTPVWSALTDLAEDRDAELVVLGSRGLSDVRHALRGSVATAVAQHCGRSVLIVHVG